MCHQGKQLCGDYFVTHACTLPLRQLVYTYTLDCTHFHLCARSKGVTVMCTDSCIFIGTWVGSHLPGWGLIVWPQPSPLLAVTPLECVCTTHGLVNFLSLSESSIPVSKTNPSLSTSECGGLWEFGSMCYHGQPWDDAGAQMSSAKFVVLSIYHGYLSCLSVTVVSWLSPIWLSIMAVTHRCLWA